jgi:hypothetical protein
VLAGGIAHDGNHLLVPQPFRASQLNDRIAEVFDAP